ncbi:hypothetical protein D3C71_2144300 [compost metagenome]
MVKAPLPPVMLNHSLFSLELRFLRVTASLNWSRSMPSGADTVTAKSGLVSMARATGV